MLWLSKWTRWLEMRKTRSIVSPPLLICSICSYAMERWICIEEAWLRDMEIYSDNNLQNDSQTRTFEDLKIFAGTIHTRDRLLVIVQNLLPTSADPINGDAVGAIYGIPLPNGCQYM